MSKGQVAEQGSHSELMAINGIYHGLVEAQLISTEKEENQKELTSEAEKVDVSPDMDETEDLHPVTTHATATSSYSEKGANMAPQKTYSNFQLLKRVVL